MTLLQPRMPPFAQLSSTPPKIFVLPPPNIQPILPPNLLQMLFGAMSYPPSPKSYTEPGPFLALESFCSSTPIHYGGCCPNFLPLFAEALSPIVNGATRSCLPIFSRCCLVPRHILLLSKILHRTWSLSCFGIILFEYTNSLWWILPQLLTALC